MDDTDPMSKFLGMASIDEVIARQNELVTYNEHALVPVETPVRTDPRKDEDFETSRDTLNNILVQGTTAIDEMMNIAKQSQNPAAYEKLAALINSMNQVSKTLLDIHVKKKVLDKVDLDNPALREDAQKPDVHNHLYVGNTADLLSLIHRNKNPE